MTGSKVIKPQLDKAAPDSRPASPGTILIFQEPISYSVGWQLQSRLHKQRVLDHRQDTVLILEHQPVFTLGRSAQTTHWGGNEDVLRANGTELHYVNRGGSVTYHGPGQIVLYPILKLVHHATGPRQLVWLLEEIIIRVLKSRMIDGHRIDKKPGVWIMVPEPAKIASVGIRVEHGVTLHGCALNVDMDLTPFQRISPCGFTDCRVTSMSQLLNTSLSLGIVKEEIARTLAEVFSATWSIDTERAYAGT